MPLTVPLPSTVDDAPAAIEAWVSSEAIVALLRSFGAELPAGRLEDRLAWLERFSQRWDYRSGSERDQIAHPTLTEGQQAVAIRAARALGLTEHVADVQGAFAHVLVLGGLVRGCLNRARAAATLVASGAVTSPSVTAVTGFRSLSGADGRPVVNHPSEVELAAVAGLSDVSTEFEVMDAAFRRYFDVDVVAQEEGVASDRADEAWRLRRYQCSPRQALQVLAAPSSAPDRRANTADGYRFFADRVGRLQAGDRLLIVTTAIYRPFHQADALRVLGRGYGASVEMVGVEGTELGAIDPRFSKVFGADEYLNEIRSTIQAYRALIELVGHP